MVNKDETVFDEIYVSESDRLTGFVYKRMGSSGEAEDVIQEVWLRLYDSLKQQKVNNPYGWIYTVARNLIIDHHRKQSRFVLSIDDEYSSVGNHLESSKVKSESVSDGQIWEALEKAMENLSEKQKYAVIEIDMKGKTYKELADESDVSMGTWLSRNYYAKQKLKTYLKYFYEEFLLNL